MAEIRVTMLDQGQIKVRKVPIAVTPGAIQKKNGLRFFLSVLLIIMEVKWNLVEAVSSVWDYFEQLFDRLLFLSASAFAKDLKIQVSASSEITGFFMPISHLALLRKLSTF
ncbi:hypothetical protein LOK49_LG14G01468 [Camellia lanceoleosa]|uniref:Uncharacterized protein n=1 Tax=Camellia lanceoleosa TaxID=1840588 RepID=A0ACC0F9X4_9ERIC|nr:hypothetical protein LOK49_LG14G01468 [Camellia lanceoleosa]